MLLGGRASAAGRINLIFRYCLATALPLFNVLGTDSVTAAAAPEANLEASGIPLDSTLAMETSVASALRGFVRGLTRRHALTLR